MPYRRGTASQKQSLVDGTEPEGDHAFDTFLVSTVKFTLI